jgi:hypothetical protein
MGEVSGTQYVNSLHSSPGCQTWQVAALACRPGKKGMDVQVCDVFHSKTRLDNLINKVHE